MAASFSTKTLAIKMRSRRCESGNLCCAAERELPRWFQRVVSFDFVNHHPVEVPTVNSNSKNASINTTAQKQ